MFDMRIEYNYCNVEINAAALPDLGWSSFRRLVNVGKQFLSSQEVSSASDRGLCLVYSGGGVTEPDLQQTKSLA